MAWSYRLAATNVGMRSAEQDGNKRACIAGERLAKRSLPTNAAVPDAGAMPSFLISIMPWPEATIRTGVGERKGTASGSTETRFAVGAAGIASGINWRWPFGPGCSP